MILALAGCVAEITLYGGPPTDGADTDTDTDTITDTDTPGVDTGCPTWLDLPPRVTVPAALPSNTGPALGSCTPSEFDLYGVRWSTPDQIGGQWYAEFEVTGAGFVGVTASPSEPWELVYPDGTGRGVASLFAPQPGTFGIAADLDAGRVVFYQDGARLGHADVAVLPGMGGYHPTVLGDGLSINVGQAPFAFVPPDGYRAWATDADGGACDWDPPEVVDPAPVRAYPVVVTSSVAFDGELVLVSQPWADGFQAPWRDSRGYGLGAPGKIDLYVERPGRTWLALYGFEQTIWTVHARPGAEVLGVSVYGFHPQQVLAPDGVPVDRHAICDDGWHSGCVSRTGEEFPLPGQSWPFDASTDTQGWISTVEASTCRSLGAFVGLGSGARHVTLE